MTRPENHPSVPQSKIGVLLINLGTPDAPEERAVRRYLAEFLSDRRVVEIHPAAWKPILHGVILRTRPRKSAEAYNQIWTNEGSPLRAIASRQAHALRAKMPNVSVHFAMRYGHPGIAAALENMAAEGCTRILAAPLYPQYCAATTATANDAVFGTLARMRWQPALRTLPPYYDDSLYIDALATSLNRQLRGLDFEPDRLLLSFHGMPVRTLELGDPYHCHCQKTARLVGEALGREVDIAFQSKFGRAKWLEPATDATLAAYPK
ncbi:MAG TPA: ferrochelatase, partial [Sphingomicrobium sp.]